MKTNIASTILCMLFIFLSEFCMAINDRVIITETDNVTTVNYPVQFGRPFLECEIPDFPQALIDGVPVFTQADVKNRYPNGSVKYAIISFLIPNMPAGATKNITFQNQVSGNNTPLSKSDMLDAKYNFDASIQLTNGTTISSSARIMLANGDFTYWTQGPVATTIILTDHSNTQTCNGHPCGKYDIGFDSDNSFRPIFHATFWPTINKVRVRFIGELSNTASMEDVVVTNLVLTTGSLSPQTAYTLPAAKAPLRMNLASRWTKEYWIGTVPSNNTMDHQLSHLTKTLYLPNYDTSKTFLSSTVDYFYSSLITNNDLYDYGLWTVYQPQTGGRADIGIYPDFSYCWFYTWSEKAKYVAFSQADLAGTWPVHFREGNAMRGSQPRYFDKAGTIPAVGKPLSLSGRPTFMGGGYINSPVAGTVSEDTLSIVGEWARNVYYPNQPLYQPWVPDASHAPDPFSIQYTLSGDFYYLEELQFWASYFATETNPSAPWGRGSTGKEGGIQSQVRGDAWTIRDRTRCAFLSPDGSAEKDYFTSLTNDAIALWEGQRNITGTVFQSDPEWVWGNTIGSPHPPSPLYFWDEGFTTIPQYQYPDIDTSITSSFTLVWQASFLQAELGEVKEKGFKADSVQNWCAKNLIGMLTDPLFDPYLIAQYRTPTKRRSDGNYFPDWGSVKAAYLPSLLSSAAAEFNNQIANYDGDGYVFYALAGASMITDQPGGMAAWNWISSKALAATEGNPKWALLPRVGTATACVTTSVNDLSDNTLNVTVYPNPSAGNFNVQFSNDVNFSQRTIKLINSVGAVVNEKTVAGNNVQILFTDIAEGVYYLMIQTNNDVKYKKVMVVR